MQLDYLLERQSGCLPCNQPVPVCTCTANESCVQTSRSCGACQTNTCVPITSSNGGGTSGVSAGALAGAVVAVIIVVGLVVGFYIWYRRRVHARNAAAAAEIEAKADVPASAEAVLNRPDPSEKTSRPPTELTTLRAASHDSANIPQSQRQSQVNPFEDDQSIQTTSNQGTNIIPIALVPPASSRRSSQSSGPVRPDRAPDLSLNYEGANADNLTGDPTPSYPRSMISGISGMSRNSYMSNASDLLNEAPMIVTQNRGAVRQVLGVVKAEVIHTPGSSSSGSPPATPTSLDSLKVPSVASRPSARSPLAATSFGPADIVNETEEEHNQSTSSDPFADRNQSSTMSPSSATFTNTTSQTTQSASWVAESPARPWANSDGSSRPSSVSTQAASVIDIGSATRVNVGLLNSQSSLKSHRTTMGRLVSPAGAVEPPTLEEQQQRALAHAQAQARAQGLDKGRRVSGSSAISAASTRADSILADSILEAFPFVPPSPISSRPLRSPPRSPLNQQFSSAPPRETEAETAAVPRPLPLDPPNRRLLGLSTVSQSSTASTGLGSFPFQIDTGNAETSTNAPPSTSPPSAYQGRQRASLDTLALMSDLSSYPLGFDRDPTESFTEFTKSSSYVPPTERPL